MRTGVFYGNTCEDHVKIIDVTKTQTGSANYLVFYAQVRCFFEVVYDDRKKYRLCAMQRYDTIDIPHPTGYRTLVSSSLEVCCVEHILEKVYVVPDFGDGSANRYLLNHDMGQHAWTNATPNLPDLDEIEEWEQDAEVNTLDDDDNDDTIITPNNDQAPPDDDDDDHVEDFLGFI
ncbi:hypothetical protein [Absidia glauca]|uniref:Uncharacterized protein n=1 Tax=Absidia glauca TaxID=4829 RepID=A0A168L988_ABSGL|nr:hypothetical protein [Absidia glauca]